MAKSWSTLEEWSRWEATQDQYESKEEWLDDRPAPAVGSFLWWHAQADKTGCPEPYLRLMGLGATPEPARYSGFEAI